MEDDLELLTRNQLIALSDSLGINHLDLLGHGSKRETWIKAIQGYRADQEFYKRWRQSQNQKELEPMQETYTRQYLITLGKKELQQIARDLEIEPLPEDTKRAYWIDAILAVAERKATQANKEVKLDNYQPLATNHAPLYQIYGRGN